MPPILTKIQGLSSYFWLDFREFIIAYLIFVIVFLLVAYWLFKVWTKTSATKIIAVNLVIFVVLLVHLFMALEIYYRYIFDATDNVLQIKTTQRWISRHVRLNAFAFRDDHFFTDKDAKELRLAVVGDSFAYGYGIKDENQRFSNLLESKLNQICSQSGASVQIYNLSRPGQNTKEELKIVKNSFRNYQLDGIILSYTLDDARSNRTPLHTDICYNRIFSYRNYPVWKFILDKSFALEYLYVRAYNLLFAHDFTQSCWTSSHQALYSDPEIWIRHSRDLKSIIEFTRDKQIGLAVVIFPNMSEIGPNYSSAEIHHRLTSFFNQESVPVIDLAPTYSNYSPEQLMVSSRDFHPNQLGHALAADKIFETIKSQPWTQCRIN